MKGSNSIESCEKCGKVAYRKAVQPVPEIVASCRNCTHYLCDHNDRMNMKSEVIFTISNSRCDLHKFTVQRNCVCASHAFHHESRRDK